MKEGLLILLSIVCGLNLFAQDTLSTKPPSIGLHFFYNDFTTPQSIKADGFGYVISYGEWTKPRDMQSGFGLDYLQGIAKKIDLVGTVNASWVDYLSPSNVRFGSNNLLLDINAGVHLKMLSDRHLLSPFLIIKAGYSFYQNINGFSFMPGAGLQANPFNQVLFFATVEYRVGLSSDISNQFYYSLGIGTNIAKPRIRKHAAETQKSGEGPAKEEPLMAKDVVVTVHDEPTGQLLPQVEVTLEAVSGKPLNAITNQDGKAVFYGTPANDYFISGRMNGIEATTAKIEKSDFMNSGLQIKASLSHNDPRFTLKGRTIDIGANKPVGGTIVTITNSTQSSTAFSTSRETDGEFRSQLEGGSDFSIVGKKAGYISNIETISTKGLNRSATLYVKLELGIEDASIGKSIVLNKIYFETGKAKLNITTSADLDRLVRFLKDNPATRLEIQGHTDNVGTMATNLKLSQQRAGFIVDYLVKHGIAMGRLSAKGYGPGQPLASNATAEGKAKNRRVEMKVVE